MNKPPEPQLINLSMKTLLKILLLILATIFVYSVRSVVGIFFVAFVVAASLDPWVDKMQKYRIPRPVSILSIYIIILGIMSLAVFLLIPPISHEVQDIAKNFPKYYERFIEIFTFFKSASERFGFSQSAQESIKSLSTGLNSLTHGLLTTLTSIFGGFVSFFGILVITFYMTIDEDGIKKFLRSVAPVKYQPYLVHKIHQIQNKLGLWLQGQLLLTVIIGVISYVGLVILGVDYALVLALVAGISEFIPYIGPIVGAVPAVFLATAQSPFKGLMVLLLYIVIQQLENQLIQPKVMQRSVGLNPVATILVMLVGAQVAGFVGVILAIPAATIIWVFLEDFLVEKKIRDRQLLKDEE